MPDRVAHRALEERLGHTFTDGDLLRCALSHRSWVAESTDQISNERLEFLGDAILGWVVADLAFHHFSDLAEGSLTDVRKSVVNGGALADVAVELDLGTHLLLGRGEDAAGGREKTSILSDAFEAVLGAVYLDGGRDAAYRMVERLFLQRLIGAAATLHQLDHKSALQEMLAQRGAAPPDYDVTSTGPDHDKTFFADVSASGDALGSGSGRSRKAAEQAAAGEAVAKLSDS